MTPPEPIAIIGSSCRFPGGLNSPAELWDSICRQDDLMTRVPPDRFNIDGFYHEDGERQGCTNAQYAYLLKDNLRTFDAAFFGINPVEADAMEPQQKLLMEVVYEALESAGISIEATKGSATSVFVGIMTSDFTDLQNRDLDNIPTYAATGISRSIASNRLSYFYDWKGPSMTIDTACSSSMVCLHLAVQSLRRGESTTAVVAGSNCIIDPSAFVAESKLHLLSPTGRCYMWDDRADGYARGEGAAALILMPLSAAIKQGFASRIEGIIRETAVNQDGRTQGLTMPSATSQANVIRSCYRNIGLDCTEPSDRCDFFEAHGTGTQTGDPIEAEAIYNAFYGSAPSSDGKSHSILSSDDDRETLLVGSIKTCIGHLEGCAGIAGVLKAIQSIKHRAIAPNMHFQTLNPKLVSFAQRLKIPVSVTKWPTARLNQCRRISVNSFGFGGTNAHAIVESFDPSESIGRLVADAVKVPSDTKVEEQWQIMKICAASEDVLQERLRQLHNHLISHPQTNLAAMAHVFNNWTTNLKFQTILTFNTHQKLMTQLRDIIDAQTSDRSPNWINRPDSRLVCKVVGVFTGQGAQWEGMGSFLTQKSPIFRDCLSRLDLALHALPDGPTWNLADELLASKANSRLSEAALAQPLTTAVQIGLVDLLQSCRITLDVVVGHSSGEIAAAYAAGILSASDAIIISYYRGLHAHQARGPTGEQGAMLATALSHESAEAFCKDKFAGQLCVAASNAPQSTTISGDMTAIQEAMALLKDDKIFARELKVDTAYHSTHMLPCSTPFLQSLRNINIQVQRLKPNCQWISSVYASRIEEESLAWSELEDQSYWIKNMISPVLFSGAIQGALAQVKSRYPDHPKVVFEIGPHPALKGPTTQSANASGLSDMQYQGLLLRYEKDDESFANAVSVVKGKSGLTFDDVQSFMCIFPAAVPSSDDSSLQWHAGRLLKQLPRYSWDQKQQYWRESPLSRQYRFRERPRHELLGSLSPVSIAGQDLSFQNVLRLEDVPYLRGHVIQGRVIFPAAGYIVMALDASIWLFQGAPSDSARTAQPIVDLANFQIHKGLLLTDQGEGSGTEMRCTLHTTVGAEHASIESWSINADFKCYAKDSRDQWILHASSSVVITTRSTTSRQVEMYPGEGRVSRLDLSVPACYAYMNKLGLQFSGAFIGMKTLQRTRNSSRAMLASQLDEREYFSLHPVKLDAALQATFVAAAAPDDGTIIFPYLPTRIEHLRFVAPSAQTTGSFSGCADAWIEDFSYKSFVANVEIVDTISETAVVQITGLTLNAIQQAAEQDDREVFSEWSIEPDISAGFDIEDGQDSPHDIAVFDLCERLSLQYLKDLPAQFSQDEAEDLPWYHQRALHYLKYLFPSIQSGTHSTLSKDTFECDTMEKVLCEVEKFADQVDVRIINTVGRHLASIFKGEVTALEVMTADGLLDDFYEHGMGIPRTARAVAKVSKRLTHRFPDLRFLEIGAGTGGTTKYIVKCIQESYQSYTFTDISAAFIDAAQHHFRAEKGKMFFRTLDIEMDPVAQGFTLGSYDVIVATNVLHATKSLSDTLKNVRSLLKPGGYLLLTELTGSVLRSHMVMSVFPGWWLGDEDGRKWGPTVASSGWDAVLRASGLSGIDSILSDFRDDSKHTYSAIISQATNDVVQSLREPQDHMSAELVDANILIIGDDDEATANLQERLSSILASSGCSSSCQRVTLEALSEQHITHKYICMLELHKPLLHTIEQQKLENLQSVLQHTQTIFWVTGDPSQNPLFSMSVGCGRSLRNEYPEMNLQFLVLKDGREISPKTFDHIATRFLSFITQCSLIDTKDNVLQSLEPELILMDEQVHIPRVTRLLEPNERINMYRRRVTRKIDPSRVSVELVADESDFNFRKAVAQSDPASSIDIIVENSTALPLAIGGADGKAYVFSGMIGETSSLNTGFRAGDLVMGLSTQNASELHLDPRLLCKCNVGHDELQRLFLVVVAQLVIQSLCSSLPARARLYVTGGHRLLSPWFWDNVLPPNAVLLKSEDILCDATKIFMDPIEMRSMTSSKAAFQPADLIVNLHTHALLADLDIKRSKFLRDCPQWHLQDAVRRNNPVTGHISDDTVRFFSQCYQIAAAFSLKNIEKLDCPLLRVDELTKGSVQDPLSILQWSSSRELPVDVSIIDHASLFRTDRTYFLIGFAGGLGQSLCLWMAQQGAVHFAIASRSAKQLDANFLQDMRGLGANVRLFCLDVADDTMLHSVHDEIITTMPPIAGVANAAMVLHDGSFATLTADDLMRVYRPKVDGSLNLDRLFATHDLDFFILFSSLGSVVGSSGQSNYNAANLAMSAICDNRRRKGFAACTIDIGMIIGVGYLKENASTQSILSEKGFMPLSERDMHQIFAEAIFMGHDRYQVDKLQTSRVPDRHQIHRPQHLRVLDQKSKLITGLARRRVQPGSEETFMRNPQLGHVIKRDAVDKSSEVEVIKASIKTELADADTPGMSHQIVLEAFLAKVQAVTRNKLDQQAIKSPLVDSGVDSLMAVQIRFWFAQELEVNISVLEILSGSTAAELCWKAVAETPFVQAKSKNDNEVQSKKASSENIKVNSENLDPQVTQSRIEDHADSSDDSTQPDTATSATYSSLTDDDKSSTTDAVAPGKSGLGPLDAITDNERGIRSVSKTVPSSVDHSSRSVSPSSASTSSPVEQIISVPLSMPQMQLFYLDEVLNDKSALNLTILYKFTGRLDDRRLANAMETAMHRHEILRSAFRPDVNGKDPVQVVMTQPLTTVSTERISSEEEARNRYQRLRNHQYDITSGKCMKCSILRLTENTSYLLTGFHHIICDNYSAMVFAKDMIGSYEGITALPLSNHYRHFSAAQHSRLKQDSFKQESSFWVAELKGMTFDPLPSMCGRSRQMTSHIQDLCHYKISIDAKMNHQLRQLAQRTHSTAFQLHVASLAILLSRFCQTDSFCLGLIHAGRDDVRFAETFGNFINTLPIRCEMQPEQLVRDFLQATKIRVLGALKHAEIPFQILLDRLEIDRDLTSHPLFQVALNYKTSIPAKLQVGDSSGELVSYDDANAPYDLWLDIEPNADGGSQIIFKAQSHLYDNHQLKTLAESYHQCLDSLIYCQEDARLGSLPLLTDKLLQTAKTSGCGPSITQDRGTVIDLILENVANYPQSCAIKSGESDVLSYQELGFRSHRFAAKLQKCGVSLRDHVAVMIEPSASGICILIAILSIGAIYVPIDISTPNERLSVILEDLKPKMIIHSQPRKFNQGQAYTIEALFAVDAKEDVTRSSVQPSETAYVIYTSGSTGKPKGVVVTHMALSNYIHGARKRFDKHDQLVVLQQSSWAFDMSIDQIFSALCNTGTLVIAEQSIRRNARALADLMSKESVSYTFYSTAEFHALIQHGSDKLKACHSWKLAITGGEIVTKSIIDDFAALEMDTALCIGYGPTETTIMCTETYDPNDPCEVMSTRNGSIVGRARENYRILILDQTASMLPVGIVGEICVAGAGVAKGYLHEEELTTRKFVRDPLAETEDESDTRQMYHTGDRGYLDDQGRLHFVGRVAGDLQVKIRGFRVELDDIESTIVASAKGVVTSAVALATVYESKSAERLIFAVVKIDKTALANSEATFLDDLRRSLPLPEYMIPTMIVSTEEFPLNVNGKIDRKQLISNLTSYLPQARTAPTDMSTVEQEVADIWRQILPKMTRHMIIEKSSDFFQIGGNSLLLMRLQSALVNHFQKSIDLRALFQQSKLQEMATHFASELDIVNVRSIDWSSEMKPIETQPDLAFTSHRLQDASADSKMVVILTGASGFLGRYILRQLIDNSTVAEVHCLAVRHGSGGFTQSVGSAKVREYEGDLSLPLLGLSEHDWQELQRRSTLIIHNGADVSFLKTYETLRPANLTSTKYLMQLALLRHIPLHYVSSASVGKFSANDDFYEVSVADSEPPNDCPDAYSASKWASEKFLEIMATENNSPIHIHRPTSITGQGVPEHDLMANLVQYSRAMLLIPDLKSWTGAIDFVKVEDVASGIVDACMTSVAGVPDQNPSAWIRFSHHCSQIPVSSQDFQAYIEQNGKYSVQVCSLQEWTDRMVEHGGSQLVADMMVHVLDSTKSAPLPRVFKNKSTHERIG